MSKDTPSGRPGQSGSPPIDHSSTPTIPVDQTFIVDTERLEPVSYDQACRLHGRRVANAMVSLRRHHHDAFGQPFWSRTDYCDEYMDTLGLVHYSRKRTRIGGAR
jgi:hypothetical protein